MNENNIMLFIDQIDISFNKSLYKKPLLEFGNIDLEKIKEFFKKVGPITFSDFGSRNQHTKLPNISSKSFWETPQVIWPEVFMTGVIPEFISNARLCADACMAWGNVHMGNSPCEKFGEVMQKIGERLGIDPTSENIGAYARELTEWMKTIA